MDLLEEINLRENLEESLFRQIKQTEPADLAGREHLYLCLKVLDQVFDMMKLNGRQSGTAGSDGPEH